MHREPGCHGDPWRASFPGDKGILWVSVCFSLTTEVVASYVVY